MTTLADANPDERIAWQDIMRVVLVEEAVRIEDGTLSLKISNDDADARGIYEWLLVSEFGWVAEAMLNNPPYYPSFATLLSTVEERGGG